MRKNEINCVHSIRNMVGWSHQMRRLYDDYDSTTKSGSFGSYQRNR